MSKPKENYMSTHFARNTRELIGLIESVVMHSRQFTVLADPSNAGAWILSYPIVGRATPDLATRSQIDPNAPVVA